MKKQGIAAAAAVLAMSLGALGAAAQGPAGVGGDQSPRSSAAPRSYNPIKWVKKDKQGANEKPTTPKAETVKAKKAESDKRAAAKAEAMNTTKTESSHTHHSLNPVNWVKKDKKGANEKPTTAKVKTVKAKKAESDKRAAAKAEAMNTTKTESSHTHHSLNPIRWIKKAPDQAAQKSDKSKNKKSSAKPAKQDSPAAAPVPTA